MIKKLLLFSASALLLGACSIEEKDEPEIIEEETEEVEVEEAEEVEEEKEIVLGKRSNPVPFGETVRFSLRAIDDDTQEEYKGKGSLVINDMVRGEEAYNKLIDYNQFNDEAPEGYEWAILNLRFTLDELENEDVPYYVYFDIKSYGDDGSEGPRESAVVGDEFGYVELYSGGTTEGKHPILLPKGDENAKVKVSDWDNNIFMELK